MPISTNREEMIELKKYFLYIFIMCIIDTIKN